MNLVYWKLKKSEKNGQNISNGRDEEGRFTTYVNRLGVFTCPAQTGTCLGKTFFGPIKNF